MLDRVVAEKWIGARGVYGFWPARAEDYTPLTDTEREEFAQDLLANTEKLDARIQELYGIADCAASPVARANPTTLANSS